LRQKNRITLVEKKQKLIIDGMNSYENGMSAFNKFRKNYNLDVIWPPPVNHISSFIAFLAYDSYTPSTAKIYVSALSFSLKCKGLQDTTQHFIVKQMLKGMNNNVGMSWSSICPFFSSSLRPSMA
jgi:hypothetical protein